MSIEINKPATWGQVILEIIVVAGMAMKEIKQNGNSLISIKYLPNFYNAKK